MIEFSCKHCKTPLQAPTDTGGKSAQCPTCGGTTEIPMPAPTQRTAALPIPASRITDADKIASFVSDLATYYMDFLETDFHKRRVPKRSIKYRNSKNLLIGLNLRKYERFGNAILKVIRQGFSGPITIKRGKYRATVSPLILDVIATQIDSLADDAVLRAVNSISGQVREIVGKNADDINEALSGSLDCVTEHIRSRLITPFVKKIEGLLESKGGASIESIYAVEEGLVGVLADPFDGIVADAVSLLTAGEDLDLEGQLAGVLDAAFVKESIKAYFSNCSVNDLFFELRELVDNNLILDKQDLYLYFCDIKFGGEKYPIFYVPAMVEKSEQTFQLCCEPRIYINKKAMEYIVQEYNKERDQKGRLKSISERIIYPQEYDDSLISVLEHILSELLDYFQLPSGMDLSDASYQQAQGLSASVSNSFHICIFDKSDEALVNDYEELLSLMKSKDALLTEGFVGLINDFIAHTPQGFKMSVEEDWDRMPPEEKLIFQSPIPLNPEQRQILMALDKPECRYIAVEGPPGTGKSHTITAIAFQAILQDHSVLVLSDKKEALDVVEDKITEAMNRVRGCSEFQNPILRLGKTGNTYNQILSTTSLNNIRNHYRAIKHQKDQLDSNLYQLEETLAGNIDATVAGYGNVQIKDIQDLVSLEKQYNEGEGYPLDLEEMLCIDDSLTHADEARESVFILDDAIHHSVSNLCLLDLFHGLFGDTGDLREFKEVVTFLTVVQGLRAAHPEKPFLRMFQHVSDTDVHVLSQYLHEYEALGAGFFGYFLKGRKVARLCEKVNAALSFALPVDLREDYLLLKAAESFFREAFRSMQEAACCLVLENPSEVLRKLMIPNDSIIDELAFDTMNEHLDNIRAFADRYPKSSQKIGLTVSSFQTFYDNTLKTVPESVFEDMLSQVFLSDKLRRAFGEIPVFDYTGSMFLYQQLLTSRMTNMMDERLLTFHENDRSTAKTLRGIIRKKKRFPRTDFAKLKEAFPCIIAGIRDYAEYIPLEPEIFDLVIIDEASQVSIAQAFPALLRAKKVVVLGDRKQFSNVKTAHARSDTNKQYLSRLETSFKANISQEPAELERLTKFDIKTSILEFFEFIANFNIMLLKHFRGYRELISYSSRYFYRPRGLQAIRIRGKPIDEVLQFSVLEHDGKVELAKNTNSLECEYILSELRKFKEKGRRCSVGIITPHTNQQKLISAAISNSLERDYFYDTLKLKIMTFDTCQGEERDVVFFSMVASPEDDKLWAVFIKDLDKVDLEEGGSIKAQRLNVGFSRAKECMHFVLSRPVGDFGGAIGQAIRHYWEILDKAPRMPEVADVDVNSPMEAKVLEWIKNTSFFQQHTSNIELKAQFPIGEYLRQLDPYYDHPTYRVDFLMLFSGDGGDQKSIIIEYDGFNEHFTDHAEVTEFNYDNYYTAEHVEREKILESYGYKFLRINRFNLGEDPVSTLSARLNDLTKEKPTLSFAKVVRRLVASQEDGSVKQCPKCAKLLPLSSFEDSSLISGIGRVCNDCKGLKRSRRTAARASKGSATRKKASEGSCPTCGSRMVRRTGRYGPFYGCSRYPRCRGTRQI